MYSRSQRKITSDERAMLHRQLSQPPSLWTALKKWYGKDILILVLAWPIGIYYSTIVWSTSFILALAVLKMNPWSYRGFREQVNLELKQYQEKIESLDHILTLKTVIVERVEANAVLEILHDEGQFYIFDIGGGELFAMDLFGDFKQWPEDWPNGSFELINIKNFKEIVPIICKGIQLKPLATMEFRELDTSKVPDDISGLFTGSLDELIVPVE